MGSEKKQRLLRRYKSARKLLCPVHFATNMTRGPVPFIFSNGILPIPSEFLLARCVCCVTLGEKRAHCRSTATKRTLFCSTGSTYAAMYSDTSCAWSHMYHHIFDENYFQDRFSRSFRFFIYIFHADTVAQRCCRHRSCWMFCRHSYCTQSPSLTLAHTFEIFSELAEFLPVFLLPFRNTSLLPAPPSTALTLSTAYAVPMLGH